MIKQILKYYAFCDGCRKQYKYRGQNAVDSKTKLEELMAKDGWQVMDSRFVVCPSCQKAYTKNIS